MITTRLIAALLTLLLLVSACAASTDGEDSGSGDDTDSSSTTAADDEDAADEDVAGEADEAEEADEDGADEADEADEADATDEDLDAEDGAGEAPSAAVVADGQVPCTDESIAAEVPEPALRQLVQDLVQDHVTRTHNLVMVAGETGLDSEETEAAYTVLDVNGLQLGQAVTLVYGDGAGDAFVNLWRRHLQLFVEYAVGVATDDQAAQDTADASLRQYSQDFAAFFASATGGTMPAEPTVVEFDGHIDTVEALIRDTLTGSDTAGQSHDVAHDHVVTLAGMISNGIQAQFPCRFPAEV